MINRAELKNFGPIEQLDWQNLGKINLVIGNNGCGKSFLLKALYSAMRTLEDYKRGDSPDFQEIGEVLKYKLWWTFQSEKVNHLMTASSESDLQFKLTFNQKKFSYSFNKNSKDFESVENEIEPRNDNSIFLPAKEFLSLHSIILNSREQYKQFGFDDTYLDSAKASQYVVIEPITDKNGEPITNSNKESIYSKVKKSCDSFKESRILLEKTIGGKIEFDNDKKRWYFIKGEQRFPMGVTAEGIKKIAILDTLLGNGYLTENSIIFIDEPESALHPEAISKLLDIIAILANQGIQFFLASHSYFVIKKLFLIAQKQQMSIPVLSYQNNKWVQSDLKNDLPDNPIIDESIKLYEQQLDLSDC